MRTTPGWDSANMSAILHTKYNHLSHSTLQVVHSVFKIQTSEKTTNGVSAVRRLNYGTVKSIVVYLFQFKSLNHLSTLLQSLPLIAELS